MPPSSALESNAFRIRYIDLWSFFFLAWIVIIFTQWFLTLVNRPGKTISRFYRFAWAAIALTSCSLMAVNNHSSGFAYADPWTLPLWIITAWIGVPVIMTALTWHFFRTEGRRILRIFQIAISMVATAVGLFTVALWILYAAADLSLESFFSAPFMCIAIWAAWALILMLFGFSRWYRSVRDAETHTAGSPELLSVNRKIAFLARCLREYLPDIGSSGRADDIVALAGLAAIVFSIVDICHSTRLNLGLNNVDCILGGAVGDNRWLSVVACAPCRAEENLSDRNSYECFHTNAGKMFFFHRDPFRSLFKSAGTILKVVAAIVVLICC